MERRTYSRFRIEAEGLLVTQKENTLARDFEGSIVDISEGGFSIAIDYSTYSEPLDIISEGDVIQFSIPDEYSLFGEERFDIISGQAKVLRKIEEDGNIVLGCKFLNRDPELDKYIINRRTSIFMNAMKS